MSDLINPEQRQSLRTHPLVAEFSPPEYNDEVLRLHGNYRHEPKLPGDQLAVWPEFASVQQTMLTSRPGIVLTLKHYGGAALYFVFYLIFLLCLGVLSCGVRDPDAKK